MDDLFSRQLSCPVCGGRSGQRERAREGHRYRYCRRCGLLWRLETQRLEDSNRYYTAVDPGEEIARSKKALYREVLERAERVCGQPGRLLDVGCGRGAFLYMARERGWEVYGVEPAEELVELAKKRGISVHPGTLSDYHDVGGGFDLITYWDVLMMVDDPRAELERVYKLLRMSGTAYFRVRQHGVLRFAEKLWCIFGKPLGIGNPAVYHPFNFLPRTLRVLFLRGGFRLELRNGMLTAGGVYSAGHDSKLVSHGKSLYNRLLKCCSFLFQNRVFISPTIEVWAKPEV